MKKSFLFVFISIFIVPTFSQHIPPCQGSAHDGQGACWGYAVGRAFNRSWNDSRCPISTLDFNNVPSNYFTWYSSFNIYAIQIGDIVAWGSQGATHVAYITNIYFRTNDGVILADRQNYGSPERTNLSLSYLISERGGNPSGYFRKKNQWSIKVQNNVEGNYDIGMVGIENYPNYSGEYSSGTTANQLDWESNTVIDAVFDGTLYNGYVRKFDHWEKDNPNNKSYSKTYSFQITDYQYSHTYTAVFKKQFSIIFQNTFVSVGHGGIITVNGTQYNSPTNTFYVIEGNSINASAIDQTFNGIEYGFDHWSYEGGTASYYTFHPDQNRTYTAYFIGKPDPTAINFQWDCVVGQPIQFHWTDNPNTGVTQYNIWRQVKHNGVMGDKILIATVCRGVQTFTDDDYMFTRGYTNDLLFYDLRQYYSVEHTYAPEYWHAAYGQPMPKNNEQNNFDVGKITKYDLTFYPNPFNPSTTIEYQIPKDGMVSLKIYDMLGKEIKTIISNYQSAGKYEINFNAGDLPSGIYLCMLKTDEYFTAKKMLMIK
jgi:hypothetical protein